MSSIKIQPNAKEVAMARDSSQRLIEHFSTSNSGIKIVLGDRSVEEVSLPPSAIRFLIEGLIEIGKGNAVRIIPENSELTTQEVADLLNLSRPYVVRILDEGKIPFHKVGTHRRVRLDDVLAYKQKSDADRLEALKHLVAEAQELDLGY